MEEKKFVFEEELDEHQQPPRNLDAILKDAKAEIQKENNARYARIKEIMEATTYANVMAEFERSSERAIEFRLKPRVAKFLRDFTDKEIEAAMGGPYGWERCGDY